MLECMVNYLASIYIANYVLLTFSNFLWKIIIEVVTVASYVCSYIATLVSILM